MENVNRAQVVDVHELINMLHRQATSNDPELIPVTLSGSVVSFDDPIGDLSLQECVVDIEPVQSGSGDPSPTNVRPISGWSDVNVYVSPTQSEQDATVYTVSLGQTVYGGTLDVVTGVLTVDRAMVDLGTVSWVKISGSKIYFRISTESILSDIKPSTGGNILQGLMCTQYKEETWSHTIDGSGYDKTICEGWAGQKYLAIYDSTYVNSTAADFKTAMNGVQLVYELAEPTTVQLTPTEVKTLLGSNSVWADSGDITVTYLSYE